MAYENDLLSIFQGHLPVLSARKVLTAACALATALPLVATSPVSAKDKGKTNPDLMALATALKCEANPTKRGMAAVGAVILNRVHNGRYGKTIRQVVYAKGQFAPHCGKPMHPAYMDAARHMYNDHLTGTYTYAPAVFRELRGCRYFHAAWYRKGGGRNYDGNIVRC